MTAHPSAHPSARPHVRPHRGAVLALVLATITVLTATFTAHAALDPMVPIESSLRSAEFTQSNQVEQEFSGVRIQLIEQDFTIEADGELKLVYQLTGDIDAAADIAPPETSTDDPTTPSTTATTTPTTTATTTPTTTAPTTGGGTVDSDDESVPESDPADTDTDTDSPDTDSTVPELRNITVDVANFAAITDIAEARLLLGPAARAGSFRSNIDGVRFADARSMVEIVDDQTALLTVSVPTDTGTSDENGARSGPDSLEFPKSGIFPIRVQFIVDDDLIGTHGTLVERRPAAEDAQRPSSPVHFAIVTAVDRPSGISTDEGVVIEAIDQAAAIIDAAAQIDVPLLVSIPPSILDRAIEQSNAADSTAGGDTGRGVLVDDELVALANIELDVSSAVAAGLDDRYSAALGAGEDAITATLERSPTRVVRMVDSPLSSSGAQLLRNLGVRYLAMTPDQFDDFIGGPMPDSDRFIAIALADGGTLPLLLTDPMSNQFSTEQADEILDELTTTEWAIRTVATTVLDHRSQGRTVRRARLIGLDGLGAPDPRLINAFVDMVATTPDVDFVSATELVGITDTQRATGGQPVQLPDVAGPDLTRRLDRINGAKFSLASTASMLLDDDTRLDDWNVRLDALLSNGVSDDEAAVVVDDVLSEADSIRMDVVLPEPFTFTLTGRSDTIPIRLGNTSDEPRQVVLSLSSSRLEFPRNDRVITLRPNDVTEIQVGVTARANGTSPVTVQLLTPSGEPLGEPVSLTARVSSLTGLGQVLTGGFLLILATWWIANWRSKRRTDDEQPDPDKPDEPGNLDGLDGPDGPDTATGGADSRPTARQH